MYNDPDVKIIGEDAPIIVNPLTYHQLRIALRPLVDWLDAVEADGAGEYDDGHAILDGTPAVTLGHIRRLRELLA